MENESSLAKEFTNKTTSIATCKLFDCLWERIDHFSSTQKYQIITYYLQGSVRYNLSTDDSFTFSKTCSILKELIEEWSSDNPILGNYVEGTIPATDSGSNSAPLSEEYPMVVGVSQLPGNPNNNTHTNLSLIPPEDGEVGPVAVMHPLHIFRKRVTAVLECMDIAFKSYFRDWAKQPVDAVFAAASSRRLCLPTDLREDLDQLTTAITKTQRKLLSGFTVRTVRTYDSTSHPLLTKRDGILR